jgi:hypothetical protein
MRVVPCGDVHAGAQPGNQAPQQHGLGVVAIEPFLGLTDMRGAQADPMAVARHPLLQALFAQSETQEVPGKMAEQGAEQARQHHAIDVQVTQGGEEAGQGHDHFGRQQREEVLKQHEQGHAPFPIFDQPIAHKILAFRPKADGDSRDVSRNLVTRASLYVEITFCVSRWECLCGAVSGRFFTAPGIPGGMDMDPRPRKQAQITKILEKSPASP